MSDVAIRPVRSREELGAAWDLIGAQFAPRLTREDVRLKDLVARFDLDRSLMLVAEDAGGLVGGALAFRTSARSATLRIIGLREDVRGQGLGRRLVEAVEDAASRLGIETINLGADEAIGFYVKLGYRAVLMLSWTRDPAAADAQIARLTFGCLAGFDVTRAAYDGTPQLFVALPRPDEALARRATREAPGCVAGFVLTKLLMQRGVG